MFSVCGFVELRATDVIGRLVLNRDSIWAQRCVYSLRTLLKQQYVRVIRYVVILCMMERMHDSLSHDQAKL